MINHMLPRMACSYAIFVIALTHCGCQSMKGPNGWAWTSKTQKNPADREVVTYLGQKKKQPPKADVADLKGRMAGAKDEARQPSFESHLRQGSQALGENRLPEARREFEKALALRPDNADCHHRLAVVADKERQFRQADEHYEAALKQRPRDPNLLSDLGYSYSLRGDDRRAETTLNEALAISPTHKGAMGNLGMIYSRQGRYEDALAMFQRGASEAETQHYLAQLFPQRTAGAGNEVAQTSGTNPPWMSGENRQPDTRGMTADQLKEAMNREKSDAIRRRQEQINAQNQRPRGDWTNEDAQRQAQMAQQQMQRQRQVESEPRNPIVLGPGSDQSNQLPVVTPGGANSGANPGGNPFGNGAPNGFAPNGYANNAQPGAATGQPVGNPNIDVWEGAAVDPSRAQQPPANPDGFRQPPFGAPQQSLSGLNLQPSNGAAPTNGGYAANGGFPDNGANLAAAQLGMNVGPGGLFPVVHTDSGPQSGFGPGGQAQPAIDSRFGAEFQSPPSYQDPGFQPARGSFAPGDPRQGSTRQPRGAVDFNDGASLAPASPGSNWPVIQAGGAMPTNNPAVVQFNDPMNRSGEPASTWADKPSLGGAAPYAGAWPPGSQSVSPANVNNNINTNGAVPNSIPNWQGGQATNRPQPRAFGPAATNQPEQWPHTQPR